MGRGDQTVFVRINCYLISLKIIFNSNNLPDVYENKIFTIIPQKVLDR